MKLGMKFILLKVFLFFLCSVTSANKSVFIISSHDRKIAQAYLIEDSQVEFQATVNTDTYNPDYGPVGVSVWPEKELAFFTFEESPVIVWSSTKSLEKAGD